MCEVCITVRAAKRCVADAKDVDETRARLRGCQRALDQTSGSTDAVWRIRAEDLDRAEKRADILAASLAEERTQRERAEARPGWGLLLAAVGLGIVLGAGALVLTR